MEHLISGINSFSYPPCSTSRNCTKLATIQLHISPVSTKLATRSILCVIIVRQKQPSIQRRHHLVWPDRKSFRAILHSHEKRSLLLYCCSGHKSDHSGRQAFKLDLLCQAAKILKKWPITFNFPLHLTKCKKSLVMLKNILTIYTQTTMRYVKTVKTYYREMMYTLHICKDRR